VFQNQKLKKKKTDRKNKEIVLDREAKFKFVPVDFMKNMTNQRKIITIKLKQSISHSFLTVEGLLK